MLTMVYFSGGNFANPPKSRLEKWHHWRAPIAWVVGPEIALTTSACGLLLGYGTLCGRQARFLPPPCTPPPTSLLAKLTLEKK